GPAAGAEVRYLQFAEPDAAARLHEAGYRVDECGLARAVGPDETVHLPRLDHQVDVGNRLDTAERHGQALDGQFSGGNVHGRVGREQRVVATPRPRPGYTGQGARQ